MTDPVLKPGVALVLAGPQGCGKTLLARRIAHLYGRAVEIDADQLGTHMGVKDVLQLGPRVLIIEGLPRTEVARGHLYALLTVDTMQVRLAYSMVRKTVKVPQVIICTSEPVPPVYRDPQRFQVVTMPERAAA